jgi:nucleoredoxin
MSPLSLLKTARLVDSAGGVVNHHSALESPDRVALYFSAHFCAPCRQFTPTLKEAYEELNEDEKKFEIVFVSLDKTAEEASTYHKEMKHWPMVEYDDETLRLKLKEVCEVEKIPALFVLGPNGEVSHKDGVNDIRNMGPMAFEMKWGA